MFDVTIRKTLNKIITIDYSDDDGDYEEKLQARMTRSRQKTTRIEWEGQTHSGPGSGSVAKWYFLLIFNHFAAFFLNPKMQFNPEILSQTKVFGTLHPDLDGTTLGKRGIIL